MHRPRCLPAVSVVVPAFKQADYIDACLDSIAAQTWEGSIEVVVVDDESPDDVSERARAHPLGAKVIRQKNTGVAGARNRGIAESSGAWVAFLDADDRWTPDKLARQMDAVHRRGLPCLSFTRYCRTPTDGSAAPEPEHPAVDLSPSARKLVYGNFVGTSTALCSKRCLDRCGGFPETPMLQRGGQDYALWLRIAAFFPLVYVPEVLTLYTVHPTNRVGADPLKHFKGGVHALEDFHDWDPERFEAVAGVGVRGVVAYRTSKFAKNLVVRRSVYPPGLARRAIHEGVRVLRTRF